MRPSEYLEFYLSYAYYLSVCRATVGLLLGFSVGLSNRGLTRDIPATPPRHLATQVRHLVTSPQHLRDISRHRCDIS